MSIRAKFVEWLWAVFRWFVPAVQVAIISAATAAGTTASSMIVTSKETLNFASAYNADLVMRLFYINWIVVFVPLFIAYVKTSPIPVPEPDDEPPSASSAAALLVAGLCWLLCSCTLDVPIGEGGRYGTAHLRADYTPPASLPAWPLAPAAKRNGDYKEALR